MLVDCLTKNMPSDVMLEYMKNMCYAFKHDDVIKNTKREMAKQRKAIRQGTLKTVPKKKDQLDMLEEPFKSLVKI